MLKSRHGFWWIFFCTFLFIFPALASFTFAPTRIPEPKLPKHAVQVPIVRQATNHSCGAAVLASLLYYWNVFNGKESDLYALLKTSSETGTHPKKIVEVARQFGLSARYQENVTLQDLRSAIQQHETIILDTQAWCDKNDICAKLPWKDRWDDGHYMVLIALDEHYTYVMDPVIPTSYGYIPISELIERWHDYEEQDGKVWKNYQLAIFIHGNLPSPHFPGPLVRVN